MTTHTHQTAPPQFVEANGIRSAYRRFGKMGGVPLVFNQHNLTAISQAKSSDHLRVNLNGHIPAIDDGGSIIWGSMAINLYLAEKYGKGSLWPASVEDHGDVYKWSFFSMTEMKPQLLG